MRVRDVVVRDTLRQDLTYVSLAEHCFGAPASRAVFGLIVFSSVGSNGAYLVFIGTVMHSLLPQLSTLAWAGVTAAAMVPVVLARNTSFLAYTSMAGNLGVLLVVAAVLVQGAAVARIGPLASYTMFRSDTFMQAFGIVGFLYSCATNLLPIEKSMKRRAGFAGAYAATTWVVFGATSAFAIANYLYFGSDVCSIIVSGPAGAGRWSGRRGGGAWVLGRRCGCPEWQAKGGGAAAGSMLRPLAAAQHAGLTGCVRLRVRAAPQCEFAAPVQSQRRAARSGTAATRAAVGTAVGTAVDTAA